MSPDQLKEGIIRVIHENDNQEVTGDIMQSVLLDMVDTFTPGIEGFPPYIGEDGFWYVFDIDAGEYVSSGIPAQGPKGDPGSGAENAVQFTPQTLTPAQQAQVWTNIGGVREIVLLEETAVPTIPTERILIKPPVGIDFMSRVIEICVEWKDVNSIRVGSVRYRVSEKVGVILTSSKTLHFVSPSQEGGSVYLTCAIAKDAENLGNLAISRGNTNPFTGEMWITQVSVFI